MPHCELFEARSVDESPVRVGDSGIVANGFQTAGVAKAENVIVPDDHSCGSDGDTCSKDGLLPPAAYSEGQRLRRGERRECSHSNIATGLPVLGFKICRCVRLLKKERKKKNKERL